MASSVNRRAILIAVMGFLVISSLVSFANGESDWNEGSILIEPDESDSITPSGSPIKTANPGDEVYFTLWVKNMHLTDQNVILSVADGPDWTIAVTGSVNVPANGSASVDLYVSVPDVQFDPTRTYPIRIEGTADVTGDRSFLIVILEPEVKIDHDLVVLPNNAKKISMNVYPGQRTFMDLQIRNKGNMVDTYDLSILEHLTTWDIQFREGTTEIQTTLGHDDNGEVFTTSILLKVPQTASAGQQVDVSISSISLASDSYGTGKRTDLIEVNIKVINGASIDIVPVEQGSIESEEYIETSFIIKHSGVVDASLEPRILVEKESSVQDDWEIMMAPSGPYQLSIDEELEVSVRAVPDERVFGTFDLIFDGVSTMATVSSTMVTAEFKPVYDIVLSDLEGAPFDRGEEIIISTTIQSRSDLPQQALVDVEGIPDEYLLSVLPSQDLFLQPQEMINLMIKLHPIDKGVYDPFDVNVSVRMPDTGINGDWIVADESSIRIDFRELPDLQIKDIDLPLSTVEEGSVVCINLTVSNNGNVPVKNATIILNEITFALSNPLITDHKIDLDPGETKVICFEWNARPAAKSIRAIIEVPDGGSDMFIDDNEMIEPVYVIPTPITRGGDESTGMEINTVPVVAGGTGLILTTALLAFITSKDIFRYPFFLTLGPLYSKLRPEHILNNRLRKRIYVYVQNHPGEHFRSILTHLDLTNGTLAHHLYTLEKEDLIRSKRDGLYRRFYPSGYQIDESRVSLSAVQTRIMELVLEQPGLSQKEISLKLNLSNSTVNYNIKSLADKEMIQIMKKGKSTSILPASKNN